MILTAITLASALISIGIAVAGVALKTTAGAAIINAISIDNVSAIQGFDQPYRDAVLQSLNMVQIALDFVQDLIIIFCFLFIVINAIKLFFSATELKKFFIDGIFKSIIVIILVNIFPAIMEKTFSLATQLGVQISGGQQNITYAFTNVAKIAKDIWEKGSQSYFNLLKTGFEPNEDGTYTVDINLIKTLTDTGMTEDDAKEFAAQNGIKFEDTRKGLGFFNLDRWGKSLEINDMQNQLDQTPTAQSKQMKRAISIVNAMKEVLTGVSNDEIDDGTGTNAGGGQLTAVEIMNMGDETLKSIFYNPFIEGSSDMLSAGSMIKTAIILSEMIAAGYMAPLDDSLDIEKKKTEDYVKYNTGFIDWLGMLIKNFVFKLAMILATIIIMIEYTLTVIEFFFVMALSVLLVPLFFLDATKSFATNIMKTVISYFFKVIVTTIMCFFVLTMYVNCCVKILEDPSVTIAFFYYLYNIMLGLILVKSAGRIASSIVSGSPSIDFSSFAHQGHSMMHGARTGMAMASRFGKDVEQATQKSGTHLMNMGNTLEGMRHAKESAISAGNAWNANAGSGAQIPEKDIKKAGARAAGAFWAADAMQSFKDWGFETFTGQKMQREGDHMEFGTVGKTYVNEEGIQRTATAGQIDKKNREVAQEMGESAMAEITNKKEAADLKTKQEGFGQNASQKKKIIPEDNQDSPFNK